MELSKRIAKDLLSIKAVFFRPDEPFTWASGIKSPVYCDNRLTLTAPEVRNDVENGLAELIKNEYPDAQVLMVRAQRALLTLLLPGISSVFLWVTSAQGQRITEGRIR